MNSWGHEYDNYPQTRDGVRKPPAYPLVPVSAKSVELFLRANGHAAAFDAARIAVDDTSEVPYVIAPGPMVFVIATRLVMGGYIVRADPWGVHVHGRDQRDHHPFR